MFNRISISKMPSRQGDDISDGHPVHLDPEKGPPRYDLRKVRVPNDDPDLGDAARERNRKENPGTQLPGSTASDGGRREAYSLRRLLVRPD